MNSFAIPTTAKLVNIKAGAWLYDNDGTNPSASNIQLSPNRALPFIGKLGTGVHIVAYDNAPKAYFVKAADVVSIVDAPKPVDTTPYSKAQLDAAVASATSAKDATISAQTQTIAELKTEAAENLAALTEAEAAEKEAQDALTSLQSQLTNLNAFTSNLKVLLGL